jgi:Fe-S oxidoreductase
MGVYDAPRNLIEAATGAPAAELFHNRALAECCGAGSVMHLTNPGTALEVAKVRLERVAEQKTETLVTACQNCKAILAQASSQNGNNLQVMDLSEFLALHLT